MARGDLRTVSARKWAQASKGTVWGCVCASVCEVGLAEDYHIEQSKRDRLAFWSHPLPEWVHVCFVLFCFLYFSTIHHPSLIQYSK